MGKHSVPGSGESAGEADSGRRRRADGGRRGVSVGVIVALIAVVVLVGGVILWRFFGDALARRSTDAAQQCLQGTATIAVVADPSIAANVTTFAEHTPFQGLLMPKRIVRRGHPAGKLEVTLDAVELGRVPAMDFFALVMTGF